MGHRAFDEKFFTVTPQLKSGTVRKEGSELFR